MEIDSKYTYINHNFYKYKLKTNNQSGREKLSFCSTTKNISTLMFSGKSLVPFRGLVCYWNLIVNNMNLIFQRVNVQSNVNKKRL